MQMARGRDERRHGDLLGPVEDRPLERLAHREVPVDVLDLDGRVVHQDAHGQGQPAQRHRVDRVPERREDQDRDQDRERDRDRDDQGAPPAPQEQEDHQAGEGRGDGRLVEHPLDRMPDEDRLVEQEIRLQGVGEAPLDQRHRGLDPGDDVERGGPARFQDRQEAPALPVLVDDVGLHRRAIVHLGHVADVGRHAAGVTDRQVVELLDHVRAAVELDLVFPGPDLDRAGGEDQVLGVDGGRDVGRREVGRIERLGVEVDHDLSRLAPEREGDLGPLDGRQPGPDEVLAEVVELLLGEPLAADAHLEDRHVRCAVAEDQGGRDRGRQDSEDRVADRVHLRHGRLDLGPGLEIDLDHAHPGERLRLDVLDVVDRGGHRPLVDRARSASPSRRATSRDRSRPPPRPGC